MNESYAAASGFSQAFGGGGGLFLHGNLNRYNSYGLSLAYDYQFVNWTFRSYGGYKPLSKMFNGPVHGVTFMPSWTTDASDVKVHFACRVTGTIAASKNFSIPPMPEKYYTFVLVEPGFAISNGMSMGGMSFCWSPNYHIQGGENTQYHYWRHVPFNLYWRACINKRMLNQLFGKQK